MLYTYKFKESITSVHNTKIQLIRALNRRHTRRKSGLFVAEGLSVIATAIHSNWVPKFILMRASAYKMHHSRFQAELMSWAKTHSVTCLHLSEYVFEKISTRNNPQDLLAVFVQRWNVPPIDPKQSWLVLENIRDPGNLGTIVRTVDATGIGGIILVGKCCDPYAREAVRASMGSIFHVPLVQMDMDTFLRWCKAWPGDVIGTHLSAREDFRQRYNAPVLLLMGSEGFGLSFHMVKACAQLVRIPMVGHIDSLNLAIATALMMYEIRRDMLSLEGGG